jgi:hypothetical protein
VARDAVSIDDTSLVDSKKSIQRSEEGCTVSIWLVRGCSGLLWNWIGDWRSSSTWWWGGVDARSTEWGSSGSLDFVVGSCSECWLLSDVPGIIKVRTPRREFLVVVWSTKADRKCLRSVDGKSILRWSCRISSRSCPEKTAKGQPRESRASGHPPTTYTRAG